MNAKHQTPNSKPISFASNHFFSIPQIPFIPLGQTTQIVNFSAMKKTLLALLWLPLVAIAQPADDAAAIRKISDEILRNGKAYDLLRQQIGRAHV